MSLATKLGIAAAGTAVAAGADCGLAQNLYDLVHQAMGLDPYNVEEFVRAAGTATALCAGGSAFYEGARDFLAKFDKDSKLPKYVAAFVLSGLVAIGADSNMAREAYDMLMLYHFNSTAVSKAVETLAGAGVIGFGLGSIYHGIKDLVEWAKTRWG